MAFRPHCSRQLLLILVIGVVWVLTLSSAQAVDWIDPFGGPYHAGSNWVGGSAPTPAQPAVFNLGATYPVLWSGTTGNTTSSSLLVTAGDVTFRESGSGGPFTHTTTGSATVAAATLRLGESGDPQNLSTAAALSVVNGGDMKVGFGSEVLTTSFVLGAAGSSGASSLTVDGLDSSVTVGNVTTIGNATSGTATLNVANQGTFETGSGLTTIHPTGLVNLDGGTLNLNGDLTVDGGSLLAITGDLELERLSTVNFINNAELSEFDARLFDSGFEGTFNVNTGADVLLTSVAEFIAAYEDTSLIVDGMGSSFVAEQLYLESRLNVQLSATFSNNAVGVFDEIHLVDNHDFTVVRLLVLSGADVTTGDLNLDYSGFNDFTYAFVAVDGIGSTLTTDVLSVGNLFNTPAQIVSRNQGSLSVNGSTRLYTTGTLRIEDASADLGQLVDNGGTVEFISGSLTLNSALAVGSGPLFRTNSADSIALDSSRKLTVNNTLAIPLGTHISLNGGDALGGDILWIQGGALYAFNTVNLSSPMSTAANMKIVVGSASLVELRDSGRTTILGDASASNGFYSNGTIRVGANTLVLQDANDAVLDSGSLTSIGRLAIAGTVEAVNGLTLDYGGNIEGYGTIDTPNDPTRPLTNNGHITGNSPTETITLTGYIKGVGTLDNVTFDPGATYAPGLSPASVVAGSLVYDGTLEIEIGGNSNGSFDRISHLLGSGTADLGGMLEVSLINGFQPSLGAKFEIISANGGVSGTFESVTTGFEAIYAPTSVTLIATSALSGDYNNDGGVDAADYTVWRDNLSAPAGTLLNDGVEGVIGTSQYDAWRANSGATMSASSFAGNSVPEPTAFAMLALAFYSTVIFRQSQIC